jgi:hypothetical protein
VSVPAVTPDVEVRMSFLGDVVECSGGELIFFDLFHEKPDCSLRFFSYTIITMAWNLYTNEIKSEGKAMLP